MEELVKKIINDLGVEEGIVTKKLLNLIGKNEPMEVEYKEVQDSFSNIYITECPSCGETLTFERFSQTVKPYSYCYSCGQKLLKKEKK